MCLVHSITAMHFVFYRTPLNFRRVRESTKIVVYLSVMTEMHAPKEVVVVLHSKSRLSCAPLMNHEQRSVFQAQ